MSLLLEASPRRTQSRPEGRAQYKTPEVASTSGVCRPRDLFPLPLAPLEQLFLDDESPAYPMQFFCRLRFDGRLRQDRLDEALRIAQARHPLLLAVVNANDARNPHWQPFAHPPPQVQWIEAEPATAFPPARFLDIRKQPGLHVAALAGSSRSDVILQFHHTACDGLGALDFATDLLTAYANLSSGTNRYRLKPLDVSQLRSRGAMSLAGWQLFRWGMRRMPALRSLWRFMRRQPSALVPHRPFFDDPAPPPAFPETCVHHLSRTETAALAGFAHGSETTLNALLVRDLFLTLAQWRQQHQLPADAWLRLMAPINLRTPADRRMPAANLSSMFFLDRCLSEEMDAAAFLDGINRAMKDIKHDDLGLAWLLALRVLRHLPGAWTNARRSRRRCLFSALLTNIGPVLAGSPLPRDDRRLIVGNLILDDVEFIPIARPLQCLGLAVSTYAGKMTLGIRYDSRALAAEQAKQVMKLYVAKIAPP